MQCVPGSGTDLRLLQRLRSDPVYVETIEHHHLRPRLGEVLGKLLLAVFGGVDLCDGAQLGVRSEDEVDGRSGPLHLAGRAIDPFVQSFGVAYPTYVDPNRWSALSLDARVIPTTILVGSDDVVKTIHVGPLDEAGLLAMTRQRP